MLAFRAPLPVLLSLVALVEPPAVRQQSPAAQQPPLVTIDRLHHPPGTVTGRAGIAEVERRGSGPVPLVLIAGAPYGWRAWEGFMARNAERYTMFAVTPAGYAGTAPPALPAGERADLAAKPWTEALLAD